MGEIMLMSPNAEGSEKHRVDRAFIMARGLGLVHDMVIDQHFAQRARIERLLGAIAENPGVLGVGIDEDTAMVFRGDRFDVIGSGAVYVADGSGMTYTNVTEPVRERTLCLFNIMLHVLNDGSRFDMITRKPQRTAGERQCSDDPEGCGRGDYSSSDSTSSSASTSSISESVATRNNLRDA
jgi:cyanophycinase